MAFHLVESHGGDFGPCEPVNVPRRAADAAPAVKDVVAVFDAELKNGCTHERVQESRGVNCMAKSGGRGGEARSNLSGKVVLVP